MQKEYGYKAFGETLQAVEMVENEYQFTARRRDGVDGIQFNRFRHYQAEFGRWNQWDRIRYQDGPNMYAYVGNRPVIFVDPEGNFFTIIATVIAVTVIELGIGGSVTGTAIFAGTILVGGVGLDIYTSAAPLIDEVDKLSGEHFCEKDDLIDRLQDEMNN